MYSRSIYPGLPTAHRDIFPADVGMIEVPQQDERLQERSLLELEEEGFISRLPLIRDLLDQAPLGPLGIPKFILV